LRELALHLLDIAENSVSAKADTVTISVNENSQAARLWMSVEDNGKGMDAEMAARVTDPFVTSRTTAQSRIGNPIVKSGCRGLRWRPGHPI
jgi:nitrogen fixation/metabolism regulation signal transduction histidine kinase